MASKFLATGGTQKLDDGTAVIYAASLGSTNLEPSKPVKTNGVLQLVSENLDIGDVNNLATDLVNKTQLEFTEQLAGYVPQPNHQRLYFKTDEKLYKLNSAGVETEIGGGGAGVNFAITSDVVNNGMIFRNNSDLDQIQDRDNFKLVDVLGTETLSVPDIQLTSANAVFSVGESIVANTSKLSKVSYNPLTTITTIDVELDVDKIKNTAGTAEVELETDGKINIVGSKKVKVQATGTTDRLQDYLSLESATDCWMTASKGIYLNAFETDNNTPNLTLNAVNGLLTIQAINGNINNLTKGNITLENIPPLGTSELNGFIFNPDAVRVDFNKLDISKGYLGLNAGENTVLQSTTGSLNLIGLGSGGVVILAQNGDTDLNNVNGNINLNTENFCNIRNFSSSGLEIVTDEVKINFKKSNIQRGYLGLDIDDNIKIKADLDVILQSAGGNVLCPNTPTTDNCVVNKSYLEANTQPKPAVYYLAANQDYNPSTAPIHTINHIEAGVATFLNIGWNGSSSGGYLQVRLSAKYPSSWATISIAEGTTSITNKYKYLPLNTTTANSYDIHTNYIDDGALATCLISPIQTPATPPIAPTRPVIKITIHNLENADTFGSNVGYVMIIEQY